MDSRNHLLGTTNHVPVHGNEISEHITEVSDNTSTILSNLTGVQDNLLSNFFKFLFNTQGGEQYTRLKYPNTKGFLELFEAGVNQTYLLVFSSDVEWEHYTNKKVENHPFDASFYTDLETSDDKIFAIPITIDELLADMQKLSKEDKKLFFDSLGYIVVVDISGSYGKKITSLTELLYENISESSSVIFHSATNSAYMNKKGISGTIHSYTLSELIEKGEAATPEFIEVFGESEMDLLAAYGKYDWKKVVAFCDNKEQILELAIGSNSIDKSNITFVLKDELSRGYIYEEGVEGIILFGQLSNRQLSQAIIGLLTSETESGQSKIIIDRPRQVRKLEKLRYIADDYGIPHIESSSRGVLNRENHSKTKLSATLDSAEERLIHMGEICNKNGEYVNDENLLSDHDLIERAKEQFLDSNIIERANFDLLKAREKKQFIESLGLQEFLERYKIKERAFNNTEFCDFICGLIGLDYLEENDYIRNFQLFLWEEEGISDYFTFLEFSIKDLRKLRIPSLSFIAKNILNIENLSEISVEDRENIGKVIFEKEKVSQIQSDFQLILKAQFGITCFGDLLLYQYKLEPIQDLRDFINRDGNENLRSLLKGRGVDKPSQFKTQNIKALGEVLGYDINDVSTRIYIQNKALKEIEAIFGSLPFFEGLMNGENQDIRKMYENCEYLNLFGKMYVEGFRKIRTISTDKWRELLQHLSYRNGGEIEYLRKRRASYYHNDFVNSGKKIFKNPQFEFGDIYNLSSLDLLKFIKKVPRLQEFMRAHCIHQLGSTLTKNDVECIHEALEKIHDDIKE